MDEFNEDLYFQLKEELINRGVDEYDASITAEKIAGIGCETVRDALNEIYRIKSHVESIINIS